MATISKMVLSLYLSRASSDVKDIYCADADSRSQNGHMTKYQNFANSKWRTANIFVKIFFGYISMIYCTPNVKFGMMKHVRI